MIRRILILHIGVMLVATLALARADPEPDWVVIKATAGAEGASHLELSARIHASATSGTQVLGFGYSVGTPGGIIEVLSESEDPTDIHTTQGAGALSFQVKPRKDYASEEITARASSPDMAPGQTALLLVFGTGMAFDSIQLDDPTTTGGSVAIETERGSGSSIVTLADVSDGGAAIAVGGMVAGSTGHSAVVETGIAGGFSYDGCIDCSVSWSSPDGRAGRSGSFGGPTSNRSTLNFTGPAGVWHWSWEGIRLSKKEPVIGAYAPIGADWTLFENAPDG